MNWKALAQSMRLPFLVLTPVCVFLGASTVIAKGENVNLMLFVLALFGALLAHISVNMLNEYSDYKSGLDLTTNRTPFSGGSGALPRNPEMASTILSVGIASLIAAFMIGVFFAWKYGAGIVPVGVAGLVLIITYTKWINNYPFLCLIAPGFGFGFLMVIGTQYVMEGEYTFSTWLIAVVPFFLVNNLLLLNQYPDIQADAKVGRNHFPIAYGVGHSNMVYGLFVLATILAIVIFAITGYVPALSLIALIPIPLAIFSLYGANKYGEAIAKYPQYLGANVAVTILTPLLLGISIIIG